MKKVIAFGIMLGLFALPFTVSNSLGAPEKKEDTKTEQKIVCEKTDNAVKTMNDKGFYHLLNMKNDNDVVENIWISGQSIVITAQSGENTCIIAFMKDVEYNPDTLQGLIKAYETQKSKQKDI
jgi:hypothetical protein